MPYTLSTRKREGVTKYCMTSKDTGKTYCYNSAAARAKGMKMHEMFKHTPRSKIRVAKKKKIKKKSRGK